MLKINFDHKFVINKFLPISKKKKKKRKFHFSSILCHRDCKKYKNSWFIESRRDRDTTFLCVSRCMKEPLKRMKNHGSQRERIRDLSSCASSWFISPVRFPRCFRHCLEIFACINHKNSWSDKASNSILKNCEKRILFCRCARIFHKMVNNGDRRLCIYVVNIL